jgi:hypothetical protein
MDRAAKEAQLISGIDTEPNNLHHCLSESIYVCRSSSFCDSLLLNQSGSNPIFQWKKYKDRCREICVRISFKNRLTFCRVPHDDYLLLWPLHWKNANFTCKLSENLKPDSNFKLMQGIQKLINPIYSLITRGRYQDFPPKTRLPSLFKIYITNRIHENKSG